MLQRLWLLKVRFWRRGNLVIISVIRHKTSDARATLYIDLGLGIREAPKIGKLKSQRFEPLAPPNASAQALRMDPLHALLVLQTRPRPRPRCVSSSQ